ncbi:MAG: T9SS type A sorting domain-containing protein [Ignavibacteriaceae bacterium]|nr:T9SS type A sorting domain-containing protein [Ignavibacteriaceae bacterium]
MPHFVEPYLHIDETVLTHFESGGKPIGGIVNDFDGQLRNTATPDIGADEFNGIQTPSDVKDETIIASEFTLEQNYPNPFNPSTTIRYSTPSVIANEVKQSAFVTLKVYDVLGNEVATLVNEEKPAGSYEVEFEASSITSGVYFYKIQAGNFVESKKMLLLK